jgi:hypothetical protein
MIALLVRNYLMAKGSKLANKAKNKVMRKIRHKRKK